MTIHPAARPVLAAAAVLLASCTTMRQAPQAPFDLSGSDSLIGKIRLTPSDIQALLDATEVQTRNRLMRRLIADIDVQYLGFTQSFAAAKTHQGAVTGLLGLGAGVASSLTGSPGVKANYSALGTLLTGSNAVVDSNYLFGQTTSALVAAMDDDRALIQTDIRRSMSQSIDEYPGQTAFADAIRYYRAGTLASAALHLQKIASSQAVESGETLRLTPIPTDEEVAAEIAKGKAAAVLINDAANAEALRTVLIAAQVPGIDASSNYKTLKDAAKGYLRANPDRKEAFAENVRKAISQGN